MLNALLHALHCTGNEEVSRIQLQQRLKHHRIFCFLHMTFLQVVDISCFSVLLTWQHSPCQSSFPVPPAVGSGLHAAGKLSIKSTKTSYLLIHSQPFNFGLEKVNKMQKSHTVACHYTNFFFHQVWQRLPHMFLDSKESKWWLIGNYVQVLRQLITNCNKMWQLKAQQCIWEICQITTDLMETYCAHGHCTPEQITILISSQAELHVPMYKMWIHQERNLKFLWMDLLTFLNLVIKVRVHFFWQKVGTCRQANCTYTHTSSLSALSLSLSSLSLSLFIHSVRSAQDKGCQGQVTAATKTKWL